MGVDKWRAVPAEPTTDDLACLAARSGPDLQVVLDPSWQVRFASSAAEGMLGLVPEETSPKHLLHFIHPADASAVVSALDALGEHSGAHAPVEVRLRTADDRWLGCEVASRTLAGPGGTWVLLSVRNISGRGELSDRRATLRQLIHFASVEYARTRWHDIEEVTQNLLRSLCAVFGASVVEVAWSDEAGAELTVEASWGRVAQQGRRVGSPSETGDRFTELREAGESQQVGAWSCGDLSSIGAVEAAARYLDAGLDSVVELRLSPDRPRAVLRLGFTNCLESWDEINTEPVSLLGLLVLSSLRRCRSEAALDERARRDSLTGVLNRGEFYRHLEQCVDSRLHVGRVGVLYCDIDWFKARNDAFGHAAGDDVLCAVASAIEEAIREGDQVARLGGDEFVALCRGLESAEQLDSVRQRILDRLDALDVPGGPVRLSIGTAVLTEGQDADGLLGTADAAMYCQKRANRARRPSGQVGDRVVEDAEQSGT